MFKLKKFNNVFCCTDNFVTCQQLKELGWELLPEEEYNRLNGFGG